MYNYRTYDVVAPWKNYRNQITTVILPDGLTSIGRYAFYECSSLTSVTIPEGVTSLSDCAFCECSSLTSVTIPEGVTSIGSSAFYCTGLTSITLPKQLAVIGEYALKRTSSLKTLIARGDQTYVDVPFEEPGEDLWYYEDDLLGPSNQVAVFGYQNSKLPEKLEDCTVESRWHKLLFYLPSYAKTHGYRFYELGVFSDVAEDQYYELPVAWANGEAITNGTDDTHFSPEEKCTRGQVVTFLWRAAGSPAPESDKNPFVDVKNTADCYYYNAVLWAVEQGITKGTDDTHFSPDDTCTRGQVVTFLYRQLG